MNVSILNSTISSLAHLRRFFYSEADFQHCLAMALSRAGYKVFLEQPITVSKDTYTVDIVLEDKGLYYPIELKYKTVKDVCAGLLGPCSLKDQSANDIGRYLFWKDVKRLETIQRNYPSRIAESYVVMLTNDKKYWEVPSQPCCTIDQLFRIHPGMCVNKVHWINMASSPSYRSGRSVYPAINLANTYIVPEWNPYSRANNKEFKYLTIVVK